MKKKGSFLSGLVVFILIIIILGGVGYLGFNIIKNANGGMTGMNMASDTTDAGSTDTASSETSSDTSSTENDTSTESTYKINQINQVMMDKEALDKAYNTISSALDKMTLDPYAADDGMNSSMNDQMGNQMNDQANDNQTNATSDSQANITVNIYTGSDTASQTTQMQMGQTYDETKMQQLHSGLYKVSVGMQLLKLLQEDITAQAEAASVDTSEATQYYINQYYKTIQSKNNLNQALTYINEAVDFININPYVDANGLVYDTERMTQLHDSIYLIAQGIVDLNKLNDDLLTQAVDLGTLAQNAYNEAQLNSQNSMETMNTTSGTGINISNIIMIVLIAFVIIFVIGLLGSIMNLFKSGNQTNASNNPV